MTSLEELDQLLERKETIDLALVDIAGFDQNIWTRCDHLRETQIPFLVISGPGINRIQEASARHGARGTLFKPVAMAELLGMIKGLLDK
jgi:DNA-binding response OmpR family regulator